MQRCRNRKYRCPSRLFPYDPGKKKALPKTVETCGQKYLGYVHVNENDRGDPGTGMVPFREFFLALKKINYDGYCVIESFDPSFEELNGNCAIWR